MTRALPVLLLILLSGCASTSNTVTSSTILSYGIYGEAVITGSRPATNLPKSSVLTAKSGNVTEQTTDIPAKIGTPFGYCFDVHASGKHLQLTETITHPKLTDQQGHSFINSTLQKNLSLKNGKAEHCHMYLLEEPWEAQAGEWQFAVYQGDTLLTEKTFRLY